MKDQIANANHIRRLRTERHWSQHTLGQKAGVDEKYIGDIERGEVDPRISRVRKIARALERSIDELYPDAAEAISSSPGAASSPP